MNSSEVIDRRAIAMAAGDRPVRSWVLLHYDIEQFPFAAILSRDVYKVTHLERLHEYLAAYRRKEGKSGKLCAKDNVLTRKVMQNLPVEAPFRKLYHHFMRRVLSSWVGRSLSYSNNPKMRIHFPGTASVSSFHHDIIVTKRIDQVNFWLPFTDVDGSATLWLESDYGKCDFAPIRIEYGQVLIFDGGYLGHGTVFNDSETTRISLDMRFSYKGATSRAEGVKLMNHMVSIANKQSSDLGVLNPV